MSDNLRWCTSVQNSEFAYKKGLVPTPPRFSELNEEQQLRALQNHIRAVVRSDGKQYKSIADAASDLGVSPGAVSHTLHGLSETCRGYKFSYA